MKNKKERKNIVRKIKVFFCQNIHTVILILWTLSVLYHTASNYYLFFKCPWLNLGTSDNNVPKISLISYMQSQ